MVSQITSGDLIADRYASALYDLGSEIILVVGVFFVVCVFLYLVFVY